MQKTCEGVFPPPNVLKALVILLETRSTKKNADSLESGVFIQVQVQAMHLLKPYASGYKVA